MAKRYDDKHRLLKTGERQRSSGTYEYRWTARNGKSHSISAETLEELRKKEEDILKDKSDGILVGSENVKLDDIYDLFIILCRMMISVFVFQAGTVQLDHKLKKKYFPI